MSDPHETGGISVTIKADEPGGKYNDPKSPGSWIVFHGSPARVAEQICEVFALGEEAKERPLYDLVNEATKLFKSVSSVGQKLGGTVLSDGKQKSSTSTAGNDDVWAQAQQAQANGGTLPAQEEKKEEADPILVALEQAKTVAEVQQIWAENQAAFNGNPDYMAAYKARGKALS